MSKEKAVELLKEIKWKVETIGNLNKYCFEYIMHRIKIILSELTKEENIDTKKEIKSLLDEVCCYCTQRSDLSGNCKKDCKTYSLRLKKLMEMCGIK